MNTQEPFYLDLEQGWRDYQDKGVMFIGVDYLDTEKEGLAYMKKYDITYPSGPDIGDKSPKHTPLPACPKPSSSTKTAISPTCKLAPSLERNFTGCWTNYWPNHPGVNRLWTS